MKAARAHRIEHRKKESKRETVAVHRGSPTSSALEAGGGLKGLQGKVSAAHTGPGVAPLPTSQATQHPLEFIRRWPSCNVLASFVGNN